MSGADLRLAKIAGKAQFPVRLEVIRECRMAALGDKSRSSSGGQSETIRANRGAAEV
jgi:hypothetical protein